jgi:transposase
MDTSKAVKAINIGEQTTGIQQVSRGRQKFEDKMKLYFRKTCSKGLVCYNSLSVPEQAACVGSTETQKLKKINYQ